MREVDIAYAEGVEAEGADHERGSPHVHKAAALASGRGGKGLRAMCADKCLLHNSERETTKHVRRRCVVHMLRPSRP